MSAGPGHVAFLAENGELYTCGNADSGRLGLGISVLNAMSFYQYLPRQVMGIPNIRDISCGYNHTVALDYTNKIWVWGNGWFGKLGLG